MGKNTYNTAFFSEPNLENCYWAGFIAADGNLSIKESKYKYIQINLSKKDKVILEQFKKITKSTHNIYSCGKNQIRYNIYSDIWFDDLYKFWNILPNKTLYLNPPNITDLNLCLSYIIGLIDGDGSICICNFTQTHNGKKYTYPKIKFMLCGTFSLINWCSNILNKIENSKYKPLTVEATKSKNLYYIRCDKLRAKLLLDKLSEIELPWKLPRKWDIVANYK